MCLFNNSNPTIKTKTLTISFDINNLMLSQSGDIVITKYEDVDNLPKMINDIINNKSTAYKYKGIVE